MPEFTFLSPKSLAEACQMLSGGSGRPVAGCTDVLPQIHQGKLNVERLVDLSRLKELDFIRLQDGQISIGALATYEALRTDPLLQKAAPSLVQAAASVGCRQTRNRGTLGGNLGNASPAGDSLPPLLVHNAVLVLTSRSGDRRLPLLEFLLGPGKTALLPGEVIRQVDLEALPDDARSVFLKLGNRQGMAVSIASAAVWLRLDHIGAVQEARIALGAVAPTAIRCPEAEGFLLGEQLDLASAAEAGKLAAQACAPIDDVRGSAAYRRHAVRALVKRGLSNLVEKDMRMNSMETDTC
ncbi:MAG: molybdopterin dehydrogenase FAD-binding protein [Chloroflexi bacterium]|nr:molybdopterin dehydrogenase FAD-binding protein [Chloroflexota bacterium]